MVIEIWEWTGKVSGSTPLINTKVGEIKSPRSQLMVPAPPIGRPILLVASLCSMSLCSDTELSVDCGLILC